ncbi:MAG: glycosyltransferase family 2 protein [Candidatus Portnoybacteria bacterium]|nr:glycosyltransferase family 2 protein [Candidatus Portnoybacteria bacterium]
MKINKISIIIPAYNEAKTIERLLARVEETDLGCEKEIIVVDDGSSDDTPDILKRYESKYRIIRHLKNRGKGAAVRSGYQAATGDCAIVQDADLEYDPRDIGRMIKKAEEENAQAVFGSRRLDWAREKNQKAGWIYHLGGIFLSALTNLLYGTKITDEPTCYKMVSKETLDRIDLKAEGFEFCPELTAKIARLGIKIYEIPISYFPRSVREGKKIKIKDGAIAIWTLIKNRF